MLIANHEFIFACFGVLLLVRLLLCWEYKPSGLVCVARNISARVRTLAGMRVERRVRRRWGFIGRIASRCCLRLLLSLQDTRIVRYRRYVYHPWASRERTERRIFSVSVPRELAFSIFSILVLMFLPCSLHRLDRMCWTGQCGKSLRHTVHRLVPGNGTPLAQYAGQSWFGSSDWTAF